MSLGTFSRRGAIALASGVGILFGTAVAANAQKVEFRGGVYLSEFSADCADNGWPAGGYQYANVRYRPPKQGDNGPTTRLAFHFEFWSTSFVLQKGALGKKFKKVVAGATGSSTYQYPNNPRIKVTSMTPSKVTASTTEVAIAGEIQGFDETPGCNVSFRASMTRRP